MVIQSPPIWRTFALSFGPTTTPSAGYQNQLTLMPSGVSPMSSGPLSGTLIVARYSNANGSRSGPGDQAVTGCWIGAGIEVGRAAASLKTDGNVVAVCGSGVRRPSQLRTGRYATVSPDQKSGSVAWK